MLVAHFNRQADKVEQDLLAMMWESGGTLTGAQKVALAHEADTEAFVSVRDAVSYFCPRFADLLAAVDPN